MPDKSIEQIIDTTLQNIGGDPNRSEALTPVLSLYVDRLNRICNRPK